nr:hypothetical protein [Tanacetum cinerariifolium]
MTITATIRSNGGIVLNVAPSGIAALLLDGGQTAHSRFAIPINLVEDSIYSISADSDLAVLLCIAKLIIWDKAPMVHRHSMLLIERFGIDYEQGDAIKEFADWILEIGDGIVGSKNDGEAVSFKNGHILVPTHDEVDKINDHIMSLLPGEERVFYSSDSVFQSDMDDTFDEMLYSEDFLNTIKMSGIPHHELRLKAGAPVICLRNIDQRVGICNDT